MEEICSNLFRVEVPLPGNPLKSVNSYVIKDKDNRNLIIDTGMNRPECSEVLLGALEELKINLDKTDLFITHVHADHLGLVNQIASASSRVFFNYPDMELARTDFWERLGQFAVRSGFPVEKIRRALEKHPGNRYSPTEEVDFTVVREGSLLEAGGYTLKCLETPGHTPGSICLYEPQREIIFTGDHVLGDITPNISLWLEGNNPLEQYLSSLDKIYPLKVRRVLPGHRNLFTDLQKRIRELKQHHRKRVSEIKEILRQEAMDAYRLASLMNWEIEAASWEEFPLMQQWFAAGEAMAHLKYMEGRGMVEAEQEGERLVFRLIS